MKQIKIKKIVAIVIILSFTLMTLSGCKYFDVQKEQQNINEETIKYLNEKYSREEAFKKYERKNIKKTIGNNSIYDYICHTALGGDGGNGCPNYPFGAANVIQMKDNTIVAKTNYTDQENKYYDSRQNEKIKNDFEEYYYKKFFGDYDYSENKISFLSEYFIKNHEYKENEIYNGLFNEYYEGNIAQYIKNKTIYVDGSIIIWINENEWESECKKIARNMENADFKLRLKGKIYFMDEKVKNKVEKYLLNDDGEMYNKYQEGVLGYLSMGANYIYSSVEMYKKGNDNNLDSFIHEKAL